MRVPFWEKITTAAHQTGDEDSVTFMKIFINKIKYRKIRRTRNMYHKTR